MIILFCHNPRVWQTDGQTDTRTDTDSKMRTEKVASSASPPLETVRPVNRSRL